MLQPLKNLIAVCSAALLLAACKQKVCRNNDPVFDKAVPGTEEYNQALAKRILAEEPADLNYYVEGYKEENKKTYLQVQVKSDSLCATLMMRVNSWAGMEDIKKKAGVGYRGAQLSGLKIYMVKDSLGTGFIYNSVVKVVD